MTAKKLSYSESDQVDALDKINKVHKSGVSIRYHYDIVENMEKYIDLCHNKNSKKLNELEKYRDKIKTIQTKVDRLNIPPVLCHGDACVSLNFLRLSDGRFECR
jgi:thiamine kinase-like enzyme